MKIRVFLSLLFIIVFNFFIFTGCCIFHEYETTLFEATCVQDGYTLYECTRCGEAYKDNIIKAKGHSKGVVKSKTHSTCTFEGYTEFECSKCNETYKDDFVQKLNHTSLISKLGSEPTCTTDGYCNEVMCGVCGKILQESEVILAKGHREVITKEGLDATCTVDGITDEKHCEECGVLLAASTKIEAYKHTDSDNNSLCDRCGIPHGENIIYISTVDALKNINNNLKGVYQLSANISLCGIDWVPIGNSEEPFTGYLYGNGFSISDISIINKTEGGLFVINSGTIDSVIIKNVSIIAHNTSVTIGGIASCNKGVIKNCNIEGTNILKNSVYYKETTKYGLQDFPSCYDGGKVSYTGVFGGLVGVNEGSITNCQAKGSIICEYSNEAVYELKHNKLWYTPGGDDLEAYSTFYFGGIVGNNKKEISDCTININNTNTIKVSATKVEEYGLAIAKSYAYIGNIAGVNSAKISNCKSTRSSVATNVKKSSIKEVHLGKYGIECNLALYEDSLYKGVIGKNTGTIKETDII